MESRHTTRGGKSKDSKADSQSIIVKYDRTKYRLVRIILTSMEPSRTVASFIRAQFDQLIEDHKE